MYLQIVKKKNSYFRKIKKILDKNNFSFQLFNRTLLHAETVSLLSDDNYDDVVVSNKLLKNKKLISELKKNFRIVVKADRIKLFYEKYTLNFYLINFDQKFLNFNGFKIETQYFKKSKKIDILNNMYFAPKYSDKIFNKIFYPKYIEILLSSLLDKDKNIIAKLKNFLLCVTYILFFFRKYSRYELNFKIKDLYKLNLFKLIINAFKKLKKKRVFQLKESEFKKLKFDPIEFNHFFRINHYGLITKNLKFLKVEDIINYLKKNNLKSFSNNVVDTIITKPLDEPIYLNKKFWKTGNNFYINPILFGFKKRVIGYEKVNNYLKLKKLPRVYTRTYYKNLEDMSDIEIKKSLMQNPIAISNQGFLSGRHRVAAMIGRLIRGEKYFPFNVYKV